jgi:putative NADH-flavin reductase
MSNVVLFGANGAIGQALAAELLSRGHTVTGVTRNGTSPTPGVTAVQGDAANAADVARLVTGADAVISAMGPRHDGSEPVDSLSTATHALIDGLRAAKRLPLACLHYRK